MSADDQALMKRYPQFCMTFYLPFLSYLCIRRNFEFNSNNLSDQTKIQFINIFFFSIFNRIDQSTFAQKVRTYNRKEPFNFPNLNVPIGSSFNSGGVKQVKILIIYN